ncbi:uncharacterized protein LOC135219680 [Macrobrachium nipponense]|uniref:uncharacterized protein LOC135219680 n=1 Tax=Macrobrachium nipponense TaxID=159736 RepID=UPI0030C880BD
MISNWRITPERIIKEVKPHYNFSYAKGVIFHQDLYKFLEEEILDMYPPNVWKVFKVPRSSMIIFTFCDEDLPNSIGVRKEIIDIRPFKAQPLQCFNCFGYGHPFQACIRPKPCATCCLPEHVECSRQLNCINCKKEHSSRDWNCESYTEHISVGYVKKLLARTTKYSDVVKQKYKNSSSLSKQPPLKRESRPSMSNLAPQPKKRNSSP